MSLHVPATQQPEATPGVHGGRFDFDDGGTYCGGWEDGKAHGHGVCTGPKGQGEYSGSWHYGFEVSGIYTWPSGSTFEGHWQNGRRHGLGVESRGRWTYRGEWTQGFKGRYGVRQSGISTAKYEGTWSNGLQDGYGSETYADSGVYQGQWQRGFRHGYGVRTSAPFGVASVSKNKGLQASSNSLRSEPMAGMSLEPVAERDRRMDELRGGFVLRSRSEELPNRRGSLGERPAVVRTNLLGLRLRKQRSTGDLEKRGTAASVRSTASSASWMSSESHGTSDTIHTDSNASFVVEDEQMDNSVTETYMGEWKNDRRAGYGVCERSDGLRYEGEWFNNKKYGYGVTTFRDGSREEGKYKNNVLITSNKKKHMFLIRSTKFRERIEAAVNAAVRASKISLQKADIAISRTATARGKAEQADIAALHSREDSDIARVHAKQFAPDFHQPGTDNIRARSEIRVPPSYETTQLPDPSDPASQQPSRSNHIMRAASLDSPNGQPAGITPPISGIAPPISEIPPPTTIRRDSAVSRQPSRRASQTIIANNIQETSYLPPDDATDAMLSGIVPTPSRAVSVDRGQMEMARAGGSAMSDRYSQYCRPPSRDGSVERFSRNSRYTPLPTGSDFTEHSGPRYRSSSRAPSEMRSESPSIAASNTPSRPSSRRQMLSRMGDSFDRPGPPSSTEMGTVKRTESLFMSGPQGRRGGTPSQIPSSLQRKKSLPDTASLPPLTLPRKEAAELASARRQQLRHQAELSEMYRANPLLYLANPRIKEWFSRQRLVIIVILVNLSMAILFIKLMT